MFLGMVVAGLLFARWIPLPFILCSLLIMVFTYMTVRRFDEPEPESAPPPRQGVWGEVKQVIRSTAQNKPIQSFMIAAFLWESTLAGLRPFIMLYFINYPGRIDLASERCFWAWWGSRT